MTRRYDEILATMPPGLDKKILRILAGHLGENNRISRGDLVKLALYKFSDNDITETDDRLVRETISRLRHDGHLICSSSGTGGYYMASSYDDVENMRAEMESRAMDLLEQSRTLKKRATEWFGAQLKMKI